MMTICLPKPLMLEIIVIDRVLFVLILKYSILKTIVSVIGVFDTSPVDESGMWIPLEPFGILYMNIELGKQILGFFFCRHPEFVIFPIHFPFVYQLNIQWFPFT